MKFDRRTPTSPTVAAKPDVSAYTRRFRKSALHQDWDLGKRECYLILASVGLAAASVVSTVVEVFS